MGREGDDIAEQIGQVQDVENGGEIPGDGAQTVQVHAAMADCAQPLVERRNAEGHVAQLDLVERGNRD